YLGYGVIGGIGLGIGYISPVSTLIKWFPDRPGLATGLAIMGFGGGALVASPVESKLLALYDSGFNAKDATSVASGSAVASMFVTLGVVYLVVMLFGAWLIKVPADGWVPEGFDLSTVKRKAMVTTASVSAANAVRTPQFWLLWVVLFCNVTAGIGILEQAAPMIQDFFRSGSGSSVDPAAAAGFVGLLSICNMAGRFVWSSTSDVVGRKPIYLGYLGVGMVVYALLATTGHQATGLFVLLAGIIISFYGGGFATIPAYLRDLFGTFQVGAIHGRLLTAWSAAGVAGPLIVNGFLDAKGTPGKLTYEAYRPALLTMVGVLAVGLVANLLVRQVSERFHEPDREERQLTDERSGGGVATATRTATATSTQPVLLVVAWAVVGLPLVYGVYETFVKVSSLLG
ncbi:MAG: OFA family MFS transporter, partial [Nocardioidaceae bacterium]